MISFQESRNIREACRWACLPFMFHYRIKGSMLLAEASFTPYKNIFCALQKHLDPVLEVKSASLNVKSTSMNVKSTS